LPRFTRLHTPRPRIAFTEMRFSGNQDGKVLVLPIDFNKTKRSSPE
jgi:hypothetical protein